MFNFTDFFKNLTDNLSEFGQSNGVGNVGGVSGTGNTGNGNGNGNVGGFNGNNNGNGNTGGGFNGNGNGVGNDGEGNGETVSTFDWRSFLDDSSLNATEEETPAEGVMEVEAVAEPVVAEEIIETTTPSILQSAPTDTFEFVSTNGADNISGVNDTGNTGIGNGNGNVGGFNGNGNGNSDADVDFAAFLPVEDFQSWQNFVPDWDSFFV